ncbi:unnamed protein product [Allacma fusca]|uniref:Uncharacterized protein n=1 Tax=Allacma fusca TaxID=39272 RepID=A0A8J2JRJ9_9HEXA|nr:unnamed protein product [Allacma fusca]
MGLKISGSPLVLIVFLLSLDTFVCSAGYTCNYNTAENPHCKWDDNLNFRLIVWISLATPLIITAVCLISCVCCVSCPLYQRMNRKKQGGVVSTAPQQQQYLMSPNGQPTYPQQGFENYPVSNPAYPQAPPPYPFPQQGASNYPVSYQVQHEVPQDNWNNGAVPPTSAPGWVPPKPTNESHIQHISLN